MKLLWRFKRFACIVIVCALCGCGFHLRGSYALPTYLKVLRISPESYMDPFQEALRQALEGNGIQILSESAVDNGHSKQAADSNHAANAAADKTTVLRIQHQALDEQALAYGIDGQLNRARLTLIIKYQIDTSNPKNNHEGSVSVSRELMINPNQRLSTDNERARLRTNLYQDAASQLMFQLSLQAAKR